MHSARTERALKPLKKSLPSAVGVLPGDPVDIRAADANVGELAVAEMRQLIHGRATALPSLEEAGN
jgi:hypothetical protein